MPSRPAMGRAAGALVQRARTDATDITQDSKKRYRAGVLKYRQMGYWVPDYQPARADRHGLPVPDHPAGRGRPGRGRRRRRG